MTFETACIHGAVDKPFTEETKAITTPIYQTATFAHPGVYGHEQGFAYSRSANPTRLVLEQRLACLEGVTAQDKGGALAFSSGMAAFSALMNLFAPGDHCIAVDDLYGGSYRWFEYLREHQHISISYFDAKDASTAALEKLLTPQTKMLYIETPTNPLMYVLDIPTLAQFAHAHNLLLVVDNTFLSPYFQKPLLQGADIVLHSGTKFLSGHNDTLAGFLVTKSQDLFEKLYYILNGSGAVLGAFDSWLVLRGIKTLPVRMERIQQTAQKIAQWLANHPKVTKVLYPSYPQTKGQGGMISFYVTNEACAKKLLDSIKIIQFAESLGGTETLLTYPATQTHNQFPEEERIKRGITNNLLRLSCGLEAADDLISDLEQGLA